MLAETLTFQIVAKATFKSNKNEYRTKLLKKKMKTKNVKTNSNSISMTQQSHSEYSD